ncbi:uncharacterized protein BDW70DRAFT_116940 [Aspergillus foveolatus]|uniref:uncharacterized protein n=1 Tax=Aspergillus foveolatus TaxID=210207 RepID=UPI003CCE289C
MRFISFRHGYRSIRQPVRKYFESVSVQALAWDRVEPAFVFWWLSLRDGQGHYFDLDVSMPMFDPSLMDMDRSSVQPAATNRRNGNGSRATAMTSVITYQGIGLRFRSRRRS